MPIKSRRRAREIALRILYEIEVGKMGPAKVLRDALAEAKLDEHLESFAKVLAESSIREQEWVDELIQSHLEEWDLYRLAVVDRVILRLGVVELYEFDSIPPAVTLNEFIEIAKKYSTADSGKFVNGVLGSILKISPKADWIPPAVVEEEEAPTVEDVEVGDFELPEVEEEDISEEDANKLPQVGNWKLRVEEPTQE